jgi:guanosine-3',5'-bis(diphosphate) 3'-pyrophosphohydrolase
MPQTLILKAAYFAAEKHKNQRRKGEDESPYINHPLSVAMLLSELAEVTDVDILSAAVLHDTIEDTETKKEELVELFGEKVAGLVCEMTDDKSLEKEVRKQLQIDHASQLSKGAALIKLADKISNVIDVTNNPPTTWGLERRLAYFDWAESVVNNLPETNPKLLDKFSQVLAEGRSKLSKVS